MQTVLSHLISAIHNKAGDTHHSASAMGLWLMLASEANYVEYDSLVTKNLSNALGMPLESSVTALNELVGRELVITKGSPYNGTESVSRVFNPKISPMDFGLCLGFLENSQKNPFKIEALSDVTSTIFPEFAWKDPFTFLMNDQLRSPFDSSRILQSSKNHDVFVANTIFGEMGVHRAKTLDGISVYSVIAEETVSPVDVISTAHEIASKHNFEEDLPPISKLLDNNSSSKIYDLLFANREQPDTVAYLPQWKTNNRYNHLELEEKLGFQDSYARAMQTISISYGASGLGQDDATVKTDAIPGQQFTVYSMDKLQLVIRFDRPFAVVAMVDNQSMWSNTPLFSSWVKSGV